MSGLELGAIAAGLVVFLVGFSSFVYAYVHFSREIDARFSGQVFANSSEVFSRPTPIAVGEPWTSEEITQRLRRALYSEGRNSQVGTYRLEGARLEIRPGPASYFSSRAEREGPVAVTFANNRISAITPLQGSAALTSYDLEPELVTTLFDRNRTKRRLVEYRDLPPVLVNAVLAAEDRRFFSHHGINYLRVLQAAFKDLRADERLQGGSTLTMQLARNFFLTPRRTFRRKAEELFLALLLEQRLSKEEIFELYADEVYLGQRGSFSIEGLGEAANAYFNKDVKSLTAPEAALLAGLIRGPNLYNPYRHAAQALRRRNYVLKLMQDGGFLTPEQAAAAEAAPLGVAPQNVEGSQAPFFVDMVRDQVLAQVSESDLLSQNYRIYTTLDPDLQRAASEAVRAGMAEVDAELAKRKRKPGAPPPDPHQPQVALLALDPHTGELRALVGGRDYGWSQLNHALARRQPGSSFKPFVYAAALDSAIDGSQPLITPATILQDEPTTFENGETPYEPRNYKAEYHGAVTLREALMLSLNNATVSLGQMVGFDKVRDLALAAGLEPDMLPTPSIALGSYVATPLEIASAYTIFANHGEYLGPKFVLTVQNDSGAVPWQNSQVSRQVLDPRIAYLMVNLMESVVNNGTGAGVRGRGFTQPAAGKTGTSHDGWFAGFTSNLLAVVWVGYDDDRQLGLSGSASALPVWAEFMKRAAALPDYHNAQEFNPPDGVVTAWIDVPPDPALKDPTSHRLEYFVDGTQPQTSLTEFGNGVRSFLRALVRLGGGGDSNSTAPKAASRAQARPPAKASPGAPPAATVEPPSAPTAPKKESVVKRVFSIFKHHDKKPAADQPPPPQN